MTTRETATPAVGGDGLPSWEDAQVQIVYETVCQTDENVPPNPEEHWEGWMSRRIVAALRAATPAVGGEARTSPLTRHLRMIARDVTDPHWAESINSAADILEVAQPASPLQEDENELTDFICETQDKLGPGCDELAIAQAILRRFRVRPASPLRGREPTLEEMAETIHKARWPADRQLDITPFADEDRNGREYCFRIARAVLSAAPPEQPAAEIRDRER